MAVHIPVGELVLDFTVTVQGVEYWVCIDKRRRERDGRTQYFPVVYRDGDLVIDNDDPQWWIESAVVDAVEEIFERWVIPAEDQFLGGALNR